MVDVYKCHMSPTHRFDFAGAFVIAHLGNVLRVLSRNKLHQVGTTELSVGEYDCLEANPSVPPSQSVPVNHMMISTPVRARRRSRLGLGLPSAGAEPQRRRLF